MGTSATGGSDLQTVLREQREQARAVLAPEVFEYYDGGAGDELALAEAEPSWQRYRLRPRVLCDVSSVSLSGRLLGGDIAHPVLLAPSAFHGWAHPQGEVETARGAKASHALMVVSTRASCPIEDIAAIGGSWWLQVYVTRDRAATEGFVRRAVAAGATALVLTGDTPFPGRKAQLGRLISLADPSALVNFGRHLAPGTDPAWAIEQDPSIDLSAIGWLAELSGLPVLVKGVLRSDDVKRCLDAGAAGLVVSNHGGRQVGRAISSAQALSEVVAASGDAPVLVDGGIRCGADAATALALGARAVLLGRPVLWALAAAGAEGVHTMLDAMVDDLASTLALLGVRSPHHLDASFVSVA